MIRTTLKGFLALGFCLGTIGSSQAQQDSKKAKMTLVIYVDQSHSMEKDNKVLAKLIPKITKRIEAACGDYRIGVSTISYADVDYRKSAEIYGTPRFVTRAHGPEGIKWIQERVESLATSKIPAGTELIQTSLVESLEKNPDIISGTEFLATLFMSDATPAAEVYSAQEALARIGQSIPLKNFMSIGITPTYPAAAKCFVDPNPLSPNEVSTDNLMQPQLFFKGSEGMAIDYCAQDLDSRIDEMMNLILAASQCLIMM